MYCLLQNPLTTHVDRLPRAQVAFEMSMSLGGEHRGQLRGRLAIRLPLLEANPIPTVRVRAAPAPGGASGGGGDVEAASAETSPSLGGQRV
jgi:hypothetical protein